MNDEITKVPQYKWSKIIKSLDDNKCAICNSTTKLNSHHIKERHEYPELSDVLENGITLCYNCHYAIHGGSFNPIGGANNSLSIEQNTISNLVNEYQENRIIFTCESEILNTYKSKATQLGYTSLNAFIKDAVNEKIERS